MSDTARRLRAQKAFSTDPAWLERMAREEEARAVVSEGERLSVAADLAVIAMEQRSRAALEYRDATVAVGQ